MSSHVCLKIAEIAEIRTKQDDVINDIKEIKESLVWINRYLMGILVAVILSLIGGLLK